MFWGEHFLVLPLNSYKSVRMKSTLVICLMLFTSQILVAQDLTPPKGGFGAFIVSEMRESKNWYQEVLGFEEINHMVNEEIGFEIANLKHGEIGLELIQMKGSISMDSLMKDLPRKTRLQGVFKFGMYISDFDAWVQQLQPFIEDLESQIVRDPITDKRMVVIRDPDGNRIQLFER